MRLRSLPVFLPLLLVLSCSSEDDFDPSAFFEAQDVPASGGVGGVVAGTGGVVGDGGGPQAGAGGTAPTGGGGASTG
ncbi:MAG TPA: hypothetical protein PLU22_26585, partial [Polyangiaceae bacterium]|nr:hypothetical protein [Polyangiaceae bacterium]